MTTVAGGHPTKTAKTLTRWARRILLLNTLTVTGTVVIAVGAASAAAPSNDTFAGATVISSLPFTTTEDTTEATSDATDLAAQNACSAPAGTTFSNSVWFAYTPTTDQQLQLLTSDSSYQVAGAVLTGTPDSFTPVACFFTNTSFVLSAGTTYYIGLSQTPAGSGGTLSLSLLQPVPPNAVLTIDPTGTFDSKSGTATISGTASCSEGPRHS